MSTNIVNMTLGEISDLVGGVIQTGPFGSQLHESDYSLEGTPVVMPRDIVGGKISAKTVSRVSEDHAVRLSKHRLKEGDIVYGRRGDIGRQAMIRADQEGWLCGTGCLRISLGQTVVSADYLHYYLGQPDVIRWISNKAVGATMPNLNTEILRSVPVRLPPMEEQLRIADILSAYDDLIENCQRRIKILEEMARSLYREWFVHFRYPTEAPAALVNTEAGPIPRGWEAVKVADAFQIIGGGTPSREVPEYWEDGEIQWYSPRDLTAAGSVFMEDSTDHISPTGLKNSSARMFAPFSVMLTSRATIGAIAINTHPATTNQGFIVCLPNDRVPTYLLYNWLVESVPTFERMASGATFKEISRGVFRTIDFALPPVHIVSEFTRFVGPLYGQVHVLQKQISNLKITRDMLLPKLMA